MGKIKLKDLYVGKIDGYNEFLTYGNSVCKDLFFEYPGFDLKKFVDGSIYYVYGDKGTGKTMLLKYIESTVLTDVGKNATAFIRFKKEIDEDQRNQIKRAGIPQAPFEEIIESEIPADNTINCMLAWQVYFVRVIINQLDQNDCGVFDKKNDGWIKLCGLINAIYNETKDASIFRKILPKIRKGNIEVNAANCAKLNLDLEWVDESKKVVSFNSVARKILSLYSNLSGILGNIYIFVDELELSLKRTKKYERDISLIRDLIFAVQYMNEIAKEKKFNVYIIAAIRNEVYRNVKSKGLEINKPIHDFGIHISWLQRGGDIKDHPLLRMLEKRFQYSEKMAGFPMSKDIWSEYFLPTVGSAAVPIHNYILGQTWYRPRDIIRLFSVIQVMCENKDFIDQATFDIIKQRYSEESWTEFEEVLTATYSDQEVEGIKQALTGLILPFQQNDFIAQINGKADTFKEVEILQKSNKKPNQILRDLYEIGIIGNYGSLPRFSFKGDKDIDPMRPLTLHYPLLRFFRASIRKTRKY